jgi:hypothetical protein
MEHKPRPFRQSEQSMLNAIFQAIKHQAMIRTEGDVWDVAQRVFPSLSMLVVQMI